MWASHAPPPTARRGGGGGAQATRINKWRHRRRPRASRRCQGGARVAPRRPPAGARADRKRAAAGDELATSAPTARPAAPSDAASSTHQLVRAGSRAERVNNRAAFACAAWQVRERNQRNNNNSGDDGAFALAALGEPRRHSGTVAARLAPILIRRPAAAAGKSVRRRTRISMPAEHNNIWNGNNNNNGGGANIDNVLYRARRNEPLARALLPLYGSRAASTTQPNMNPFGGGGALQSGADLQHASRDFPAARAAPRNTPGRGRLRARVLPFAAVLLHRWRRRPC
jgi:hypothetical protein